MRLNAARFRCSSVCCASALDPVPAAPTVLGGRKGGRADGGGEGELAGRARRGLRVVVADAAAGVAAGVGAFESESESDVESEEFESELELESLEDELDELDSASELESELEAAAAEGAVAGVTAAGLPARIGLASVIPLPARTPEPTAIHRIISTARVRLRVAPARLAQARAAASPLSRLALGAACLKLGGDDHAGRGRGEG